MRLVVVLALCAGVGCNGVSELREVRIWDFQRDRESAPPGGWVVPRTAAGGPAGDWRVASDTEAPGLSNVLRQHAIAGAPDHLNLAVADTPAVGDFRLQVQVRPHPTAKAERIRSERRRRDTLEAQRLELAKESKALELADAAELQRLVRLHAASPVDATVDTPTAIGVGVFFRYADAANHYAVWWDVPRQRVVLERVRKGERTRLGEAKIPVLVKDLAERPWRRMVVAARGPRVAVSIDDVPRLDLALASGSPRQGKVGVWTWADAVTSYDDFKLEPLVPIGEDAEAWRHGH